MIYSKKAYEAALDYLVNAVGDKYLGDPEFSFGNTWLGPIYSAHVNRYHATIRAFYDALTPEEKVTVITEACIDNEDDFLDDAFSYVCRELQPELEEHLSPMVHGWYQAVVEGKPINDAVDRMRGVA